MKPCLFCDHCDRPPSTEDVIPNWLRHAFETKDLESPVIVAVGGSQEEVSREIRSPQHLVLKLKGQICEPCNTKWLSRLENAVASFLGPMVVDARETTLEPAQQGPLATWATKTVLLVEFALRQKYPDARTTVGYEASEVERAWLLANNEPPPRSRVWLGAFNAENKIDLRHEACLLQSRAADVGSYDAHLTTLTVGYVAFQVFTTDFVQADHAGLPPFAAPGPHPHPDVFTQVWPQSGASVKWPARPFRDGDWDLVCTWPRRLVGIATK